MVIHVFICFKYLYRITERQSPFRKHLRYFLFVKCFLAYCMSFYLLSCSSKQFEDDTERLKKSIDLLNKDLIFFLAGDCSVFKFDQVSKLSVEGSTFVSENQPEMGGICFSGSEAYLSLPKSNFLSHKIHVLMSPENLLSDKAIQVTLMLNDYSLGTVLLSSSPSWYSFEIPGTIFDKIKRFDNQLVFKVKKLTKLPVFLRLFQFQISDEISDKDNQFIFKDRFSRNHLDCPSIIVCGEGSCKIPIGSGESGELKFLVSAFSKSKEALITIRCISDTSSKDIWTFKSDSLPTKSWKPLSCIIPDETRWIDISVKGNVVIGRPELWVSIKQKENVFPDILFVSIDTLRSDHVGIMGDDIAITPYLDEVGYRGTIVQNMYSQASVTNPSHASMFTGQYLHNHNVLGNRYRLSKRFKTLAEYFRGLGYNTVASVGATHMSAENSGFGQGFWAYYGTDQPKRDGLKVAADLVDVIASGDQRPLFIFLHLFDAHTPYGETPFKGYFTPADEHINKQVFPKESKMSIDDARNLMAYYHAEIADADRVVYWVDLTLRRFRSHRDHITVIVSDHGESLYEHNLFFQHHTGLYEKHVQVPTIMFDSQNVWPSLIIQDRKELIDIFPTLLHRVGLVPDPDVPGEDIFERRVRISKDIHAEAGNMAVAFWHGKMKLIKVLKKHPDYREDQLFDLETDPFELKNLCDESGTKDIYKNLSQKVATWIGVDPESSESFYQKDKKVLQALKSLGYVQ